MKFLMLSTVAVSKIKPSCLDRLHWYSCQANEEYYVKIMITTPLITTLRIPSFPTSL